MVQDQLVEYINTQLKSGVSADSIKTTLVGAGWQAADVDDTMKKVQPPQGATAAAAPAGISIAQAAAQVQVQPQQPKAASSFSVGSIGAAQKAEPQVIRVSDLVSASGPAKPAAAQAQPMQVSSAKTDAVMAKIASGAANGAKTAGPAAMMASNAVATPGVKKSRAIEVETILGILMVIFGAAAAFFYFQNSSLSSQIAALNGTSGGAASALTTLQGQFEASTTALNAAIASANAEKSALALDLSFLMVPSGMPATTTFTAALQGTVSGGGKLFYAITTPHGVKVFVANSKDARVISLLQPLVGTTSVQLAGNYIPGVASITLTAVNGTSVVPPPTVATSTATSTANTTGTSTATTTP